MTTNNKKAAPGGAAILSVENDASVGRWKSFVSRKGPQRSLCHNLPVYRAGKVVVAVVDEHQLPRTRACREFVVLPARVCTDSGVLIADGDVDLAFELRETIAVRS